MQNNACDGLVACDWVVISDLFGNIISNVIFLKMMLFINCPRPVILHVYESV